MYDPGLPPKPKSLNLLESLVKEEEDRARESERRDIYVPSQDPHPSSLQYFNSGKQSGVRKTSAGSYSQYRMKETKLNSKVVKGNPNAGFKGKKVKKQRSRSDSSERLGTKDKKSHRPFSADYNQNKRELINSANGRVKSAKVQRGGKMSTTKGQRPESYSSDSYSSDEEYIKKKYHRNISKNSDLEKKTIESDSFFDSDNDRSQTKAKYSSDDSKKYSSSDSSSSSEDSRKGSYKQRASKKRNGRRDSYSSDSSKSSSDSYSSSEEEDHKKTVKRMESHESKSSDGQRSAKTVYVDKLGHQHSRPRSGSNGSDYKRLVVVDDYSSLSSDEEPEPKTQPSIKKPPRLLARKKKAKLKVFQIAPDMYLEGKLQQKYCELEELMACSFVDQKRQITRHHLYQMELLRDQYKNASHGRPSSALIIPRSLPEGVRNKGQRPSSAKKPLQRYRESDTESYENAYETIRSVMAAERARKTNKIRTDIHAERPTSGKRSVKKKKKIEAKFKSKVSDSEEDISEKPSTTSKGSNRSDGSSLTPRGAPAIDHHIKYSENIKLKKWLKEKDKLYRKNIKVEKKKKREEREKLINEANDTLERKIESRKKVREWTKEKNKEHKQEKKKHDMENSAKQKEVVLPGESMQSKTHKRTDDVTVESNKCKGQETPEYVKDQIHKKREIKEENKQASLAAKGGPHPPQTKFIYKRPVAGKIKLNMQVRGKSPVGQRPDSGRKENEEKEKSDKMRLSYDEWVKRKMEEDSTKKKNASKMKENELAKSDPELNRLIPDLAKRRIEDKLNSRKKVSTGIKHFDDKISKSFGGAEFDGDAEKERPRSAYRLEGTTSSGESTLTTKQVKRPSTAPTSRGKMPLPKKSASSPRKAIIPQRADKIMDNKDESNPYTLPFPPEKGVPAHVAARQRKLFADKVADKLSEQDQNELLQEVLVKEGVADIDEMSQQNVTEPETEDGTKQADITSVMYSPRKRTDSSESSESDNEPARQSEVTEERQDSKEAEADSHIDSFGTKEGNNTAAENVLELGMQAEVQSSNQYKTYENLNNLPFDSVNTNNSNSIGADLGVDMERLRERVELLTADSTGPPLLFYSDPRDSYESRSTDDDDHESVSIDSKNIKVISEDTDQNLIGILKESKKMDNIPVPEKSDEPTESSNKTSDIGNDESDQLNAEDSLNASRKRVSFNEQTEVFQSLESSSSTDTLTPEQGEFDPNTESLDAQPYDDDYEYDSGKDEQGESDSDKLSFNIGGFELNPTVIDPSTGEDRKEDGEGGSTFITDPN